MSILPVTFFTGFLGSGKTTLLTSLLATEHEQRFAIVVNEFGEVSVDDLLLQQARGPHRARLFPLTRGLIAYAGDDFLSTMLAISHEAQLFDHVLVETSGLAVPTAAIDALHGPALQERFLHDATVTVVDTPLLLAGAYEAPASASAALADTAATEVFQQQLLCADVVVLNKIDHCSEDDLLRAETAIRTRASTIRFVEFAWQARLDARLVLGLHLNEFRATLPGRAAASSPDGALHNTAHTHSGLGTHAHGLLTHEHMHEEDPGWLSFVLRSPAAQQPQTLHDALAFITAQEPVLRVKGFAHVPHMPGHILVQGVRERITCTHEPSSQAGHGMSASATRPSQPHAVASHHDHAHGHQHSPETMAELVFIGYHLNRQSITAHLCQQTGTPWY
ncbi:MAG: GTP-binding protein [Candidatus Tectimicrobiota bacterium]